MSLHGGTTKFWRCYKSSERESTRPETTEISFRRIQPTLHEHMSQVSIATEDEPNIFLYSGKSISRPPPGLYRL